MSKSRSTEVFAEEDLLHTGSTILNLALTEDPRGGLLKGKYFYLVGDSDSGKTFWTLTMLAEASINPEFNDYRLIYDDVEGGALMNKQKFFGAKLAERLEPASGTRKKPVNSGLVEEFYFHLYDAFKKGEPFIYVLDSQDALGSLYANKKFNELKASVRTGSKVKGDYGDGKAKFHSGRIRDVIQKLEESRSILIIVNQTRDVLDAVAFGPKSQASGGRALKFYAAAQIWTSRKGEKSKTIKGKKRQIGIDTKVKIRKNRITGKEWTVEVPIYFSHGLDDVGSCVEFLVSEGRWKKNNGGVITADDFDGVSGNLDKVVQQIEEMDLTEEVVEIATEEFQDIVKRSAVKRKKRYE